jgi:hypothetical protein
VHDQASARPRRVREARDDCEVTDCRRGPRWAGPSLTSEPDVRADVRAGRRSHLRGTAVECAVSIFALCASQDRRGFCPSRVPARLGSARLGFVTTVLEGAFGAHGSRFGVARRLGRSRCAVGAGLTCPDVCFPREALAWRASSLS